MASVSLHPSLLILALTYFPLLSSAGTEVSINCYRCKSRNFTDRTCHDPFDKTTASLVDVCKVPMGSTRIMVPANYCIKVVGTSEITGEEFIIRDCVLDKPEDECYPVEVDGDVIKKCSWTCGFDGCNKAPGLLELSSGSRFFLVLTSLIQLWLLH